jgi:hypothetical protein
MALVASVSGAPSASNSLDHSIEQPPPSASLTRMVAL